MNNVCIFPCQCVRGCVAFASYFYNILIIFLLHIFVLLWSIFCFLISRFRFSFKRFLINVWFIHTPLCHCGKFLMRPWLRSVLVSIALNYSYFIILPVWWKRKDEGKEESAYCSCITRCTRVSFSTYLCVCPVVFFFVYTSFFSGFRCLRVLLFLVTLNRFFNSILAW